MKGAMITAMNTKTVMNTWIARLMRSSMRGVTALDVVVSAGIMATVGGMAAAQLAQSQPYWKGDGAMRILMKQMSYARELSITQRRMMTVTFVQPNQIVVTRQESNGGQTVLSTVGFEGGATFAQLAGVPDTPDAFGAGASVSFGASISIAFNSDGTLVDQTGNPVNGTIFVAINGNPRSHRAVTILGATGRVRAYRWSGGQWVMV